MMCCMPSVLPENPSLQAKKIFRVLRVLFLLQLMFGVFTLFVSISEGFYMLIGALILFMIVCGRNWCTGVCYVVITIFDLVGTVVGLGQFFSYFGGIPRQYLAIVAIYMIKLPFYTVTMYYAFLAYRELKALTMEVGMGGAVQSWENEPAQRFEAFGGNGYSLR